MLAAHILDLCTKFVVHKALHVTALVQLHTCLSCLSVLSTYACMHLSNVPTM